MKVVILHDRLHDNDIHNSLSSTGLVTKYIDSPVPHCGIAVLRLILSFFNILDASETKHETHATSFVVIILDASKTNNEPQYYDEAGDESHRLPPPAAAVRSHHQ